MSTLEVLETGKNKNRGRVVFVDQDTATGKSVFCLSAQRALGHQISIALFYPMASKGMELLQKFKIRMPRKTQTSAMDWSCERCGAFPLARAP